ncbi:MAG TPA: Smr/MutS family protein [Nitrospirota bacterium]|nr:Smr/MutS family protein [Nitrospirota bacterium]
MKKKKSSNQPSADFKNNPFMPLKGFAPQAPPKKTAVTAPLKKVLQSEDDSALFLRAVSGARRMTMEEEIDAGPLRQPTPDKQDAALPEDRELFLKAMQKIGTTFTGRQPEEEELEGKQRRSPTSRMRQLKRGSIRIGDELDLHGFLKDEALARLERFIASAYQRGLDAVLVITGKGVNSPEGPVLKGAAATWLGGRGKGMVAEFSPSPRDKGGSGAFVVFLKKK